MWRTVGETLYFWRTYGFLRLAVSSWVVLCPFPLHPDHIHLKNGQMIKDVRIVQISNSAVTYQEAEGGPAQSVPRSNVQRVQYAPVDWKQKEIEKKRAALQSKQAELNRLRKSAEETPALILRRQIDKLVEMESRSVNAPPDSPILSRRDLTTLRAELEKAESLAKETEAMQNDERETSSMAEQLLRQEATHKAHQQRAEWSGRVARSMLLPGWGQLAAGDTPRGYAWIALFSGVALKTKADYDATQLAYERYRDFRPFTLLHSEGASGQLLGNIYYSREAAKLEAARRQLSQDYALLGLVWIGSLVDLLFFIPGSDSSYMKLHLGPSRAAELNFSLGIQW